MIPELTARTVRGAVDLLPFLQRDAGAKGVELREWERDPAALALHDRGWHVERIAAATGLHAGAVRDVIAGVKRPRRIGGPRLGEMCKKGLHWLTGENAYIDGRGNRECRQCRRDRDQAKKQEGRAA